MAARPTVLVIETNGKAALPVIESLARAGLRVACGCEKRYNTGFYSRGCRERYVYPSARHAKPAFQAWLLDFLARHDIDTLMPVGHYGTLAVSEIQDAVRRHTRLVLPDHATFLRAYGKIGTMKTAIAANVPIPLSWFPADEPGGIEAVAAKVERWPVLVKPDIGVGARGITWCYNAPELIAASKKVEAQHGPSYVQDFVPPGGMQYKVDMLVDARQRCLGGVVYGKTRMYPPDGGSSVLNFSADRPDVLDSAYRMCVALRWVGICDFDFVEDPRDRVVKLMEINPRFPESFRMGTSVGIDFPKMIYDLAHGREVEPVLDYPKNRFLRFLPGDLMWFLRVDHRRRFGTWPSWFRFFDSHTVDQVFSLRDVGPMIGYIVENAVTMMDRSARQERLRLGGGPRR